MPSTPPVPDRWQDRPHLTHYANVQAVLLKLEGVSGTLAFSRSDAATQAAAQEILMRALPVLVMRTWTAL